MANKIVGQTEQVISKIMSKRISFKTVALTTFEKVTLSIITVSVFFMMIATIYTRNQVNSINAEIESLKNKTAKTVIENQILQQKIDDLMTAERINDIAQKYGLTHNGANIKNITK